MKSSLIRAGLAGFLAIGALTLSGCGGGGGTGATGATGATGPAGPPGTSASGAQSVLTIASNSAPVTDAAGAAWAALAPKATVNSVTINGGPPVVKFTVTDASGNPLIGLGNTSLASGTTVPKLTNLSFALAKLVPGTNGSPNYWVNYSVTTVPTTTAAAAPSLPTSDSNGTLVDNGDGTYQYTFYRDVTKIASQVAAMTVSAPNNTADLGDLTYAPSLVHRLSMVISGSAPGTGTNTPTGVTGAPSVTMTNPLNVLYDFVPSTGQAQPTTQSGRDIVATSKCDECHDRLGGIAGDTTGSSAASFHGGARNDARFCVVCHTDQMKYGSTEATTTIINNQIVFTSATQVVNGRAVGNLPNHVHKIHMGQFLVKQNYNFSNVLYNKVLYPQDLRNCTTCHDGSATSTAQTAQGDNWKNVPSRLACGACHDGINFATGMGVTVADALNGSTSTTSFNGFAHGGQAQPDDSLCASCHTPANINTYHLPVTPPDPANALLAGGTNTNTNAAWIASSPSRLPPGAISVTYAIKSVSVNSTKQPVMVFQLQQNGTAVPFNNPTASTEIWPNFMGSPSVYFVYAVPQDGITAPADFNASTSTYLRSLWNGTATGTSAGTLAGPDANGNYTATLTGVTIPANAVMLTGGLGYSYGVTKTLPLTQTNLPDYPVTPATATSGLTAGMPNMTGGLIVPAPDVQMVVTGYTGRRPIVDNSLCLNCHQQLGVFTQATANFSGQFHAAQRNNGSTCSWCHNPNLTSNGWPLDSTAFIHEIHGGAKRTHQFTFNETSATAGFFSILYPGVLRNCEACHLPGTYDFSASTSASSMANRQYRTVATGTIAAPVPGTPNANSPYVTTGVNYGAGFSVSAASGVATQAAATTLVNSPIASQCFACHDSTTEQQHMAANGALLYVPRSVAIPSLNPGATVEQCMICHGPGAVAAIEPMHANVQQP